MAEQAHIDIIIAGFNAQKSDDDIMQDLLNAGVLFKDLRSTFNEVVRSHNLRLSAKERKLKTAETLSGFAPTEGDEVKAMSEKLAEILKVPAKTAMTAIRSWAKANGVDLPRIKKATKPKVPGFKGQFREVLDYVKDNKHMSDVEIMDYAMQHGMSQGMAKRVVNTVIFAKAWAGDSTGEMAQAA
jgi:hypothetical protein